MNPKSAKNKSRVRRASQRFPRVALFKSFFLVTFVVGLLLLLPAFIISADSQSSTDNTQSEFNNGTYATTSWQSTAVKLSASQTSGDYTSQVFDGGAGNTTSWDTLSWQTEGTNYQTALSADANTVGLWHLDETSGTLTDSSTNANSGTASGGTFAATGKFSNAFTFDGVDDTIAVSDANSLDLADDFTIEGWFKPSGNGTAEGDIITGVVDSLEYDIADGRTPFIIAVDADTFAIAYDGTDNDGWLATVDIDATGAITNSINDSLEYDTGQGLTPTMAQIDADTFAIAYKGVDNDGFLTTVDISAAGVINNAVTETLEFDTNNGGTPFIFQVSGSIYGIAYTGLMGDGYVITISIDSAGDIGTIIDTLEFDTADGAQETVVGVDTNTFAIAYSGTNTDGWLATVDIDSSGNISNAVTDTLEFDTSNGTLPTIVKVDSDTYAIAYVDVNLKGTLVTVGIDSTGVIDNATTDSFQFDGSQGDDTRLLKIGTTSYATVYRGPDNDGWLQTITISTSGIITKTAIDSLEFDVANGSAPRITLVKGNIYAIAYAGTGVDGFVATTSITSRRGIFKGVDSYRLDANATTAYADVNQNVISAAISSGWNHIVMTFDKDAASNQQKLYVNGALAASGTYTSALVANTAPLQIGYFYAGDLDELAFYNSVLSASTILDHYKRGTLNLKFQARSGSANPPTGSFTGPGGSTSTYYTSSGSALTDIANNRYFQYIAYFTTTDTNFSSELQSVTINFTTTDITAPVISSVSNGTPSQTSATISWTTDESANSRVDYGTTTAYGQTVTDSTNTMNHSLSLAGLTAGTTYHYRVKSTDAVNNTATSSDYTFTTALPDGPVISTVNASNITISSTVITWGTDTASTSQVFYGTSSGNLNSSTTRDENLVTAHSVSLSNLSSGTVYFYQVKSVDATSTTTLSSERSFTTAAEDAPEDSTTPLISNLAITGVSNSEATISWMTNEAATSQVEYGLTTNYGQNTGLDTQLLTDHRVTLGNLVANTMYHVQVKSADAADNLIISDDVTFTTDENPVDEDNGEAGDDADQGESGDDSEQDSDNQNNDNNSSDNEGESNTDLIITDVISASITSTQATISWVTNKPANSVVLFGTMSGQYTDSVEGTSTSLDTSHQITLYGLSAETRYVYIVQSTAANSQTTSSGEKEFITDVTAPVSAGDVAATIETQTIGETVSQVEILPTTNDKIAPVVVLDEILPNPTDSLTTTFRGKATEEQGVVAGLAISLDDGQSWRPVSTVLGIGTKEAAFTYTTPQLDDGNFTVKARARDNSDNVGYSGQQTLVIDRMAPVFGGHTYYAGTQNVSLSSVGMLQTNVRATQKIVLTMKGGPTKVTVVGKQRSSGEVQNFDLKYLSASGFWVGEIIFNESGVYDLVLVATDGAGRTTSKDYNVVEVMSTGQVRQAETSQPLAEAQLTLFQRHPETLRWHVWAGAVFGQQNPFVTTEEGGYQWQLPPGDYYLEVSKTGFRTTLSDILHLTQSTQLSGDIVVDYNILRLPEWSIFAKTFNLASSSGSWSDNMETAKSSSLFFKIINSTPPSLNLPLVSINTENLANDLEVESVTVDENFENHLGQKFVITFWSIWEPQSQEQFALLDGLPEDLRQHIIPVAVQAEISSVQTYLKRGYYQLVSLVDATGQASANYAIVGLPQHFFVSSSGRIQDVYVGVINEQTLRNRLNHLK